MSVTVVDLAAEHRGAGPFVATWTPRLSWRVATTTPDWYQASYEIEVAGDLAHRSGPIAARASEPCPYFRREFALAQPWRRAVLSVTALGVYQVEINGRRVADEELAPGWTSYRHSAMRNRFVVVTRCTGCSSMSSAGDGFRGAIARARPAPGLRWSRRARRHCGHRSRRALAPSSVPACRTGSRVPRAGAARRHAFRAKRR